MSALTKSMCWKMLTKRKDKVNNIGVAIYRKPSDNSCYDTRTEHNPPICQESDDPDAAWYAYDRHKLFIHIIWFKFSGFCVSFCLPSILFSLQVCPIASMHAQAASRF